MPQGNIPLRNLSAAFIIIFLLISILGWFNWNSYRELNNTQQQAFKIVELSRIILQYDEVLTMSAKMASVSGDLKWEKRYRQYEPQLDTAIKKLLKIAPDVFTGDAASKTDVANSKLVSIENAAFKLIGDGKLQQAQALLNSGDYALQKQVYANGIQQITTKLENRSRTLLEGQSQRTLWSVVATFTIIPLLLFIWFTIYKNLKLYIEQRKQSEDALRKSEAKYRELFDLSPIGLALCEMDGQLVTINHAYADIIGYSIKETLNLSYWDVTPQSYEKEEEQQLELLNKTGRYGPYEKHYRHKDGHLVPVRLNGMMVSRDNKSFIWSSVEDITSLKNAEEENIKLSEQLRQSHKMEAIGTLAGGIAHDFNNLLGIILGYAEIIRDTSTKSSKQHNHIEQILKAGGRAKELVSQILSFSRKENKESSPVQIHLLVEEVLKLLRSSIPTTIDIRPDIDRHCGYVMANATQIHQVIMNLCTNAAQAMEQDGGILKIGLSKRILNTKELVNEPSMQPGPYIELCIKDTGKGIEQQNLDKIFDPYFTTKEFGKGSGMGLAVVMGIVKSYGGMLTVDSHAGKGSTFCVYLPAIEGSLDNEIDGEEKLPGGNEKILVVDDEEHLLEMMNIQLESLGYQVTTSNSSIQALEIFESAPTSIDMVITDQTMPELNGGEFARKLLATRSDLPVIICSGHSSTMDEEKAKSIGVSYYLMKPVNKNTLAKTVRNVLDKNKT